MSQVLDGCRDLIFIKNDRFEFVYANRALLDLYPEELRDSIIGRTTVDCFTDEESTLFLAQDREALEAGSSQTVEQIVDYKGRKLTFSTQKTRFIDDNGNLRLLGVATDISDLAEQTRRLIESNDTLERCNKTLEKFASFAAHDLASPLGTASLMLQSLQFSPRIRDDAVAQEAIQEVLGVLQSSTANISTVLILQKAVLTNKLERERVDLTEVAHRVAARLKAPLNAASGQIVIDALPVLECQPILVEALLQNLIENSIKYRSSAALVVRITHTASGMNHIISVEDNGAAMSARDRERVFELFAQGDSNHTGVGIGLSLCKGIVDAHSGSLWIDADYHGGTKVSFTLSSAGSGDPPIAP